MSTIATNILKNPSSGVNNIVLNTDGTTSINGALAGSALASTAEVQGTHTTGTITSGTTSLTVASATGITAGMYVVGEGITPGTIVSSIVGTTVALSVNANTTLSADPVSFYAGGKLLTPGLVAGQLCRAWVSFDGDGTVTIGAAYNVTSITDNGTGDYTVNFTTAMPDSNFVVAGVSSDAATGQPTTTVIISRTTTSVRIETRRANDNNIKEDVDPCTVSIFR